MTIGPRTQLKTSDAAKSCPLPPTAPSLPYRTFARTGYIIQKRPTAIGRETPPTFTVSSAGPIAG